MSLPVADKAIINASPLICLARSRNLYLLQGFAQEIWVPEPVAKEILYRGPKDITAKAIEQTKWLIIQKVPNTPSVITISIYTILR